MAGDLKYYSATPQALKALEPEVSIGVDVSVLKSFAAHIRFIFNRLYTDIDRKLIPIRLQYPAEMPSDFTDSHSAFIDYFTVNHPKSLYQ